MTRFTWICLCTKLMMRKLQELREDIKKMLKADVDKPAEKLDLVDTIQRLGVSCHFQTYIDQILEKVYKADEDSDIFNKFKDNNGDFKASLAEDIGGILSFYEATHFRVHGETILDEAFVFTTTLHKSMATQLSSPLAALAHFKHALYQPLRKGLPRLEANQYMTIYQEDSLHNEVLLTFAKLDFNILQKVHQKELSDITRWWKTLDVENKLPFARDRLVELYFWIMGVYFEPDYGYARRILSKVNAMCSILDDIYDVHGTIEELELFTTETENVSAMHQLPEYMKITYGALLDVYGEIEKDMAFKGKLYRLDYAKDVIKILVIDYFNEAKWCDKKYVPTIEEYLSVALLTSCHLTLAATSFVGMGDVVTQESFEWVLSNPKIVKASAIIGRLMNDIAGHKDEQKRAHVASAVECYLNQHNVSEEEAVKLLRELVEDAWKDIIEEFIKPAAVPMPLLERVLNLTRVIDLLYKEDDCYTNSHLMKRLVAPLLTDPVLL
ncbi:(-)-germacrene D synthase-like [Pistacia vera]|uniref:(-)-germacrene D synthase-like n=1 Tax=Pistacia vera TaxID=55513 RepID=UPI001262C54B|nr:(-)-germacrene D synthase-like [Pistacia vera]